MTSLRNRTAWVFCKLQKKSKEKFSKLGLLGLTQMGHDEPKPKGESHLLGCPRIGKLQVSLLLIVGHLGPTVEMVKKGLSI